MSKPLDNSAQPLSQTELDKYFEEILQLDSDNRYCFHCEKKVCQYFDFTHGIFVCRNCREYYEEKKDGVKKKKLKSFIYDVWCKNDIQFMKRTGNKRLSYFLQTYQLQKDNINYIKTKAIDYYKKLINNEIKDEQLPNPPEFQEGRQTYYPKITTSNISLKLLFCKSKEAAKQVKQNTNVIKRLIKVRISSIIPHKSKNDINKTNQSIRNIIDQQPIEDTFKIGEFLSNQSQSKQSSNYSKETKDDSTPIVEFANLTTHDREFTLSQQFISQNNN